MIFMFNPLHFIDKIKQAIFMRLVAFMAKNSPSVPMIKQREFMDKIDPKKLRASNDGMNSVVEPFK
jgi:hypothetical protein